MNVDALLGPLGLLVGALLAVGFLSRELFKFIREYISSLQTQLTETLALLKAQTEANRVLADAQAARNRDDEMRHRLDEAAKRGGNH